MRHLLIAATLLVAGCSGSLIVEGNPCEEAGACTSELCSPDNPTGTCPDGQECVTGVCYTVIVECCSGCQPNQGCDACACVPLGDVICSPTTPEGRCPGGEVCIAGACQPVSCGAGVDGCCPTDTACVGGSCRPISERPCAEFPHDGLCASGSHCDNGTCVADACGEDVACGACPADSACSSGACVPLACSALHPTGACDEGSRCTGCGCLDEDLCCNAADCAEQGLPRCSVAQVCIAQLQCIEQGDCPSSQRCCSTGQCVANDVCCSADDCPEGFTCAAQHCEPTSGGCTTNTRVPNDGSLCDPTQLFCCPAGETCCDPGKTCNVGTGACLSTGTCLTDDDCAPGFACSVLDYQCEPIEPCDNGCEGGGCQGTCASGTVCSVAGGCIPVASCAANDDCAPGSLCNAENVCEIDCSCGCTPFAADPIDPNVLTLLDRSSSMTTLVSGPSPAPRWDVAVDALGQVIDDFETDIRFGLGTFPARCPGNECTADCPGAASCSLSPSPNCLPGGVNVPVDDGSKQDIVDALAGDCPGGFTPTGPTLRNIRDNPGAAGLADTDRSNSIILVTDGEANCDPVCDSSVDTGAVRVYSALDDLLALTPSIRTYIIGFGIRTARLNCYAVHGGTSRCTTDDALCSTRTTDKTCRNEACEWNGTTCVGSTSVCATFTSSSTCGAAGCKWVASSCQPDNTLCGGFTTEEQCDGRCAWRGTASCTGNNGACAPRTQAACETGCAWTSACTGDDTGCAAYNGSPASCTSNGCFWTGSACTGLDTTCDDRTNATSCRSRCLWNGTSCEGNDAVCDGFASSSTCSNAGCRWTSICGGDDTGCGAFLSDTACLANGCSWNGTSCEGNDAVCNGFTSATRCGVLCDWNGTTCDGDNAACAAFTTSQSCSAGGCLWTSEGTCRGFATECAKNATQATCESRCKITGTCSGDDTTCGAFQAADLCAPRCSWAAACTGAAECSLRANQTACTAACDWNGSACVGDANCPSFTTSGTCGGAGCSWTAANVCVGVNATTCVDAGTCYYLALDAQSLGDSLAAIAGEVASCTYALGAPVDDWRAVSVFLDYGTNPLPAECLGRNPCALGPAGGKWIPNVGADSIDIRGSACADIQDELASPLVVQGCGSDG